MHDNARNEGLSPKQEKAIIAMLSEATLDKAAKRVKVDPSTLYRWTLQPEFKEAFTKAQRECWERAIGHLQRLATAATQCLENVMSDPNSNAGSKVSAARTILEYAARGVELQDFEQRLSRLEERIQVKT